MGILALAIEAFYLRLVCTNGLMAKTAVDARYKHISRKVMADFPEILRGVISQSHRGRDRFMISTQTHVDHPESTIEVFARQFQIVQEEAEVAKQAYLKEPGATMFHIINAFTRAAQQPSLEAYQSYRLEKAGGQILSLVKPLYNQINISRRILFKQHLLFTHYGLHQFFGINNWIDFKFSQIIPG